MEHYMNILHHDVTNIPVVFKPAVLLVGSACSTLMAVQSYTMGQSVTAFLGSLAAVTMAFAALLNALTNRAAERRKREAFDRHEANRRPRP